MVSTLLPHMSEANLIPAGRIERRILLLRSEKVTLDSDLAELYGVETKVLNQAVKRNLERFPEAFMFQLSKVEATLVLRSRVVTLNDEFAENPLKTKGDLRSQMVTLKRGQHRKFRPYALMRDEKKPKREIGFHTLMPKPGKSGRAKSEKIRP